MGKKNHSCRICLVFGGGRLWFSDLKEGEVWAWVHGRWVSQGNPLKREVTP